ncbi:hypothetical protein [Halomicrobium salinisoli]|uniref:hypothetical protein n=1 Tax=Halomicrobium salinisoli TaxID=2878391 RepID=UPI001CEFE0EE|nr:hypothetical protein [Halomicrobium salinisoli]
MSDDGPELSVDEFVEYCRTQAGLLSGKVERMSDEAAALLDEIDDEMTEIQQRLDEHAEGVTGPQSPPSTQTPADADLDEIEDVQSNLETKQALVEAKQTRIEAFQALAAGYAELGAEIESTVDDAQDALQRVVEFEAEQNAPAYFDERETLLESVATEAGTEVDDAEADDDAGD